MSNSTDCISRQAVIDSLYDWSNHSMTDAETWHLRQVIGDIKSMPSVTPQLSSELEKNSKKLEKDFGELDCISREQALKELKESAEHHANDSREEVLLQRDRDIIRALPSVTPQEPFKPMVEIDLYSVIKQKYIERKVLDKIRDQLKSHLRGVKITLEVLVENDPLRPKMEGAKDTLEECLEIIDKAETENT